MENLKILHTNGDPASDSEFMPSKGSKKAPEQTFEEVKYLRYLIENGVPVSFYGVALDVTDRKLIENALERREFQTMALQSGLHTAVQVRRRELHRVRGDYPCVQSIEPA